MNSNESLIQPFGEVSFEIEEEKLGDKWEEYFFEHTHFVREALNPSTYLIVGRRGSGKSTLGEYFSHQEIYKNSTTIYLGKAEKYEPYLFNIAQKISYSEELATQRLVELWKYIFWQLIFRKLASIDKSFKDVLDTTFDKTSNANFVKVLIEGLVNKFIATTGSEIIDIVQSKMIDKKITKFIEKAKKITINKNIFIVIDSREQYDKNNHYEMWITSALIQCASILNVKNSSCGINIKVSIADEVFPYIEERFIVNNAKYIRNPLHLYWRPKDLIRLICWRFFKYLKINNLTNFYEKEINWESFEDIYSKIWIPHFGETLLNLRGRKEKTLPYILRHTHLRPRQVITICNHIAKLAHMKGEFPYFSDKTIVMGVYESERGLANSLLNSYRSIYPNCADIVSAIEGLPIEFRANELDRVAPRTSSQWEHIKYNKYEFKRLTLELGIIGRKKGVVDERTGIIRADFEFSLKGRIFINENDTCVIHPMFYDKFNINRHNPTNCCIYPFPDHPDFHLLQQL